MLVWFLPFMVHSMSGYIHLFNSTSLHFWTVFHTLTWNSQVVWENQNHDLHVAWPCISFILLHTLPLQASQSPMKDLRTQQISRKKVWNTSLITPAASRIIMVIKVFTGVCNEKSNACEKILWGKETCWILFGNLKQTCWALQSKSCLQI